MINISNSKWNNYKHCYITVLMFLLPFSFLKGQQIFPVSVEGIMTGPNSLSLADYSSTKAQDIMFFITLRDPVEATRRVKLRFSISNDGEEVIATDPNFNAFPITLEKGVPLMLDGNDLAPYFQEMNLVGIDNQQSGTLIPEGYNGFCIEVIDVERNVVISDKFCTYGFFEYSDPPILNTPICDETLIWAEAQNILFNWLPQHLSSSNPPMGVEYKFKLVELLPDQTPNDAFQFSTPLYEETTFATTLFYMEDAPLLEVGKVYAWSVQAVDGQGIDLFNNNGYSQICTFTLSEPNVFVDPAIGNCQNGLCDWTGNISLSPATENINIGDLIDIGFFTMEITDIQNINSTYSGTGNIYVPFLYSNIKVEFSDLLINEDHRVFGGEVRSVDSEDARLNMLAGLNDASDFSQAFSDATASALNEYFDDPNANLVSVLSAIPEESAIPITVPIGMDLSSENGGASNLIAITGLTFGQSRATLNAAMSLRLDEDGQWIKFGVKDYCIQPGGLAGSGISKIDLLSDYEVDFSGMPITFLSANHNSEGTYVSWDCEGFVEFFVEGQFIFDETKFINHSNEGDAIIASFRTSTQALDDILVEIDAIDDFSIVGEEEFVFSLDQTKIDLSSTRNIGSIQFPEDDAYADVSEDWTGLYIENLNLTIPEELQLGGTNTSILGHHLVIDKHGASGVVGVNDFISTATDAMGDWAFTVDHIGITFSRNNFVNATIDGTMEIPLIDEPFNYLGDIKPLLDSDAWRMSIGPNEVQNLNISALKTGIAIGEESVITLDMDPNVNMRDWRPYADLSGSFFINIENSDFENPGFAGPGLFDALSYIEDFLGINMAFNPPSIDFSGFKINHPDLPEGITYGIDDLSANVGFSITGLDFGIDDIEFLEVPASSIEAITFPNSSNVNASPIALPALGFKFKIGGPGINFDLDFWGKKAPDADFSFGKIDMNYDLFSFSCSSSPTPLTNNFNPGNAIELGSSFRCGGFSILVDDSDITKGTIAIPFLPNSNLHVTLSDVALNEENRMISGEVIAQKNVSFFEDQALLIGPELLPIEVPLLENIQGVDIDFSQNLDFLPFSLTSKIEELAGENLPFDFLLSGIKFTPEGADLDVVLAVEMGDQRLKFGAKGLKMSPSGVNLDEIQFYLMEEIGVEYEGWNMTLLPSGLNGESYVTLSCQGLEEFVLISKYDFGSDYINANDAQEGVFAEMVLEGEKWGEFIGSTSFNAPFYLKGYEDFTFTMTNASVDLSTTSNINGIEFPENEEYDDINATWTGFFIEEVNLTIPEELQLGGSNSSIFGYHLIIDRLGTSGVVGMKDFISTETNSKAFGDWEFSIDSVGFLFLKNEFVHASLEGMIGIPLMSESFEFEGSLSENESNQFVASLNPKNDALVGLSFGPDSAGERDDYLVSFNISKSSNITGIYHTQSKKFIPNAELCGGVTVQLHKSDFPSDVQDVISEIENNLPGNLPFEFDANIQLCLGIDPSLTLYNGKMYDLINYSGSVSLPGFSEPFDLADALSLSQITLDYSVPNANVPGTLDLPDWPTIPSIGIPGFPNVELDAFPIINIPGLPQFTLPNFPTILPELQLPSSFIPLGFNFHLPAIPGLSIDLGCWAIAIPDPNIQTPEFDFAAFTVDINLPDFSCSPDEAQPFTVIDNPGNISVPFLGMSFEVEPIEGTANYKTKPDDPFFENMSLKSLVDEYVPAEINFDLPEDYNFEMKGITFTEEGQGLINLEMTLSGITFVGALPIHPSGINFDGFKFGPGTDVNFGN